MLRQSKVLTWLPFSCAATLIVGFATPFVVAALRDDVNPLWPYISDTGARPPESCIFTLFLVLAGQQLGILTLARHWQVCNLGSRNLSKASRWATVMGGISCLGLVLVASFQDVNVMSVHLVGAAGTFFGGIVFEALTTWLCYQEGGPRWLVRFRIVLTVTGALALISTCACAYIAWRENPDDDKVNGELTFGGQKKRGCCINNSCCILISCCIGKSCYTNNQKVPGRYQSTTAKNILTCERPLFVFSFSQNYQTHCKRPDPRLTGPLSFWHHCDVGFGWHLVRTGRRVTPPTNENCTPTKKKIENTCTTLAHTRTRTQPKKHTHNQTHTNT
eukprot:m.322057 g.322057  ORF g.322057 m.322057 type:complete len:332 (-) comp19713_c0_seq33:1384-2379(-)